MSCTLTNEELIHKVNEWVHKLAESGGTKWCLSVPVDFNNDPDMLFIELGERLKSEVEDRKHNAKRALEIAAERDYYKELATIADKTIQLMSPFVIGVSGNRTEAQKSELEYLDFKSKQP